MPPSDRFEREARNTGVKLIAGIDEAGRGPLAGPVVAAAVVLGEDFNIEGLDDSKLLNSNQRQKLFTTIGKNALSVGLCVIGPETIDRINILQATRLAMINAVRDLSCEPELLLIDGPIKLDVPIPQEPIVKGDKLSISISAASIMAKVTRDGIMKLFHNDYPNYGFASNKGYGTKEHLLALEKYGPCAIHRKTFHKVKEFYERKLFDI